MLCNAAVDDVLPIDKLKLIRSADVFFKYIFPFVNKSTKGNIDDTHSGGIYDARPPGLVFPTNFSR
jgi:hypothetical protein